MMWFTMLSWLEEEVQGIESRNEVSPRWISLFGQIPTHETSAQLLRLPALLYSRPDSSSAANPHQSYPGPLPNHLSYCSAAGSPHNTSGHYLHPQGPLLCLPGPRKVGPGDLKSRGAVAGRPAECGIDGSGSEQHCQWPAPLPTLKTHSPPPPAKEENSHDSPQPTRVFPNPSTIDSHLHFKLPMRQICITL